MSCMQDVSFASLNPDQKSLNAHETFSNIKIVKCPFPLNSTHTNRRFFLVTFKGSARGIYALDDISKLGPGDYSFPRDDKHVTANLSPFSC